MRQQQPTSRAAAPPSKSYYSPQPVYQQVNIPRPNGTVQQIPTKVVSSTTTGSSFQPQQKAKQPLVPPPKEVEIMDEETKYFDIQQGDKLNDVYSRNENKIVFSLE